jgi:hypothetical protein
LFDTLGSVEACAADVAFTASTHDRAVSRDTGANHVAGVTLAIPIRAFHLGLHLPAPNRSGGPLERPLALPHGRIGVSEEFLAHLRPLSDQMGVTATKEIGGFLPVVGLVALIFQCADGLLDLGGEGEIGL